MEETYEKSIFEEGTQLQVAYGGFWERFGALILDWLVLLPLTIVNYFNGTTWKSTVLSVIIGLAYIVYKPLLEYLYGATLGKKGLTLTVVNRNYQKINGKDAVLRNIFQIVTGLIAIPITVYTLQHGTVNRSQATTFADFDSGTLLSVFYVLGICVLYLADAICLVANPKKQSLHDLIASTYVIRKMQ